MKQNQNLSEDTELELVKVEQKKSNHEKIMELCNILSEKIDARIKIKKTS